MASCRPPPSPPEWRVGHAGATVSSRAADRMPRPARCGARGPMGGVPVAAGAAWHGLCLLCLQPLPPLEPRWGTRPTVAPEPQSVAHGRSEERPRQEEVPCAPTSETSSGASNPVRGGVSRR